MAGVSNGCFCNNTGNSYETAVLVKLEAGEIWCGARLDLGAAERQASLATHNAPTQFTSICNATENDNTADKENGRNRTLSEENEEGCSGLCWSRANPERVSMTSGTESSGTGEDREESRFVPGTQRRNT